MFCGKCGAKNIEDDVFCTSCGENMKQAGDGTASAAPPVPPPAPPVPPVPPPVPPPARQQPYSSTSPTYQTTANNSTASRAPGEIILTVMGILVIIAAVSSFFSAITGLQAGLGVVRATLIINLLVSPYLCYMGIAGLRYSKDSEKAQMLLILGGIAIAIALITMIVSLATTGVGALSGAVVALLRPALLIYGARKNQSVN